MVISSIDLKNGHVVQLKNGKELVLQRDDADALISQFDLYGEVAVIDLDAALGNVDAKGNTVNTPLLKSLLHKGNVLALDRLEDDRCRLSLCLPCFLEGCADLIYIIAVRNIDHMEIKRFELLIDWIRAVDFFQRAVDLKIVVVDDHAEVVKLLGSRKHGSFPYLAFLNLSVSEQCVNAEIPFLDFSRDCHSNRAGNALSQRAGGHIHTGDVLHVRVTLQDGPLSLIHI